MKRLATTASVQQLLLLFLVTVDTIGGSVEASHQNLRRQSTNTEPPAPFVHIPLLSHHAVTARRRLQQELVAGSASLPEDTNVDPLYQGLGTHYVDLWVGCPPQRQTVIVDTGSAATAFPCSGCNDCGTTTHTDKLFQHDESTCFRPISCEDECLLGKCHDSDQSNSTSLLAPYCRVHRSYEEGSSWQAFESIDKVYTGGNHDMVDWTEEAAAFDLRFGCQTHLTGLFKTQLEDGIMGMKDDKFSYWKQMYDAGGIQQAAFSLCFSKAPTASRQGSEAGAMIMGGSDTRLHQTLMVYAQQSSTSEGFFRLTIEKIHLRVGGGESIVSSSNTAIHKSVFINTDDLNEGSIQVDSGTSATYLTKKLAVPFRSAWKSATGQDYGGDQFEVTTEEEMNALPTILFQLKPWKEDNAGKIPGITGEDFDKFHPNSILVAFPPSHYMTYVPKRATYVSHFSLTVRERKSQTLGANFLMGKDLHFDMDNGRIGFAESNCDYFGFALKNFNSTTALPTIDMVPKKEIPKIEPVAEPVAEPVLPPNAPTTTTTEPTSVQEATTCSSLTCQTWLIGGFLAWIALAAFFILRQDGGGSSSSSSYHQVTLQQQQQQLQEDEQGNGACELREFKPYSDTNGGKQEDTVNDK